MIGLDATTLIAHELLEHPLHRRVKSGIRRCVADGDRFGLADQTLWEFLHVVTDSRRFSRPLEMAEALRRVECWSTAREVVHLPTTPEIAAWTCNWMNELGLGRKRILDTALAATFHVNGISRIATANTSDFAGLGRFSFEDWARS